MKLSEAILLGYPEIKHTNTVWLEDRFDGCQGCALGAALWAVGYRKMHPRDLQETLLRHWPWIKEWNPPQAFVSFGDAITSYFAKVMSGGTTIERLVDWVRKQEADNDSRTSTTDIQHSPGSVICGRPNL